MRILPFIPSRPAVSKPWPECSDVMLQKVKVQGKEERDRIGKEKDRKEDACVGGILVKHFFFKLLKLSTMSERQMKKNVESKLKGSWVNYGKMKKGKNEEKRKQKNVD